MLAVARRRRGEACSAGPAGTPPAGSLPSWRQPNRAAAGDPGQGNTAVFLRTARRHRRRPGPGPPGPRV